MNFKRFVFKRLIQVVPMLIIVSILAFILSHISAGDIAEITLRSKGIIPTPDSIAAVRTELGLDRPLYIQYLSWLVHTLQGDFGTSIQSGLPVSQEIMDRFPATLKLALVSTLFAIILCVPIALVSVRFKDTPIDHGIRFLTTVAATLPDFCLGLLLLYIFAIQLHLAPVIAGDSMQNILLPALTLSAGYAAMYTRILRNNLIEVSYTDYIRAARARGLGKTTALFRHGLKNAVLPCMTLIGVNFGKLLGGQFACETIFSWNGIGKFAVDSIRLKDLPVIQGYIVVVAVTYIVINLLIDVLYVFIDPKIMME